MTACARRTRCSPPWPGHTRGTASGGRLIARSRSVPPATQERALHLAFATDGQDAGLAATVAAAAAAASARGARAEAVVLGEQALRLTPADSADRGDRLLGLAEYLARAGERQRVTDLVAPALETLPHGRQRARAWLLLSEGGPVDSHAERARHYRHALAASTGDPDLSAHVLAIQAFNDVIVGVGAHSARRRRSPRTAATCVCWAGRAACAGNPSRTCARAFGLPRTVPSHSSTRRSPCWGCGSRGVAR